jgi:hypothetical protein
MKSLQILQPTIIQSFEGELYVKPDPKLETIASYGNVFVPGELDDHMSLEKTKDQLFGSWKLLYLSKWRQQDIQKNYI